MFIVHPFFWLAVALSNRKIHRIPAISKLALIEVDPEDGKDYPNKYQYRNDINDFLKRES
jgi:hypothetical protein